MQAHSDLASHLKTAVDELDLAALAIEAIAEQFVRQCRDERRAARIAISRQAKAAGMSLRKGSFSPYILLCRTDAGSLYLFWARIKYTRSTDKTRRYHNVPSKNGIYHLSTIIQKAHRDECELIQSHELKARQIRTMWHDLVSLRTTARHTSRRITAHDADD